MKLDLLLIKYPSVLDDKLDTMKTFNKLDLNPGTKPKFFKPRPLTFALKKSIEQELHQFEDVSIITKVSYSSWAGPIMAVSKMMGHRI